MATQPSDPAGITESCRSCGKQTLHRVRVEIVTESAKKKNAQFSREPYRVSMCQECGVESRQRMNDA